VTNYNLKDTALQRNRDKRYSCGKRNERFGCFFGLQWQHCFIGYASTDGAFAERSKEVTHAEIIDYCLQKSGAYLDWPFDPISPVLKIKAPSQEKGRIFALPFMLRGEPKVTLGCTPEFAEFYRSVYPGSVVRGWHCPPVLQPHFNTVSLDGTVPDKEIISMIDHAYAVVFGKLPKYVRRELEGVL
jgi:predicted DNA-binding protein (MmcQ/YjbR family)